MKIISPFSDYYDSCRAYGIDDKITYVRKTEHISSAIFSNAAVDPRVSPTRLAVKRVSQAIGSCRSSYFTPMVVGFCGKLYVGLKYYVDLSKDPRKPISNNIGFTSGPNIVASYAWQAGDLPAEALEFKYGGIWNRKTVGEWFAETQLDFEDINLFHTLQTPVFVVDDWNIFIEPKLVDYKFQRRLDPFTVFQELSMFLGGVLQVGDPAMEEISDEVRIQQHGFDKRSFRKEPTKHRR